MSTTNSSLYSTFTMRLPFDVIEAIKKASTKSNISANKLAAQVLTNQFIVEEKGIMTKNTLNEVKKLRASVKPKVKNLTISQMEDIAYD